MSKINELEELALFSFLLTLNKLLEFFNEFGQILGDNLPNNI